MSRDEALDEFERLRAQMYREHLGKKWLFDELEKLKVFLDHEIWELIETA